jgi:hypothetical protein
MMTSLLEKMERNGQVVIVRSGPSMREVMLPPSAEVDEKDEATVNEAVQTDIKEQESAAMETEEPSAKVIRRDRLNALLRVLREVADPDGTLKGVFISLAAREMNVTENTVRKLSADLGKLGFRQLTGSKKDPIYQIDMSDKEVAMESLETLEPASSTSSAPAPEQAAESVHESSDAPQAEQSGSEQPAIEPQDETEPVVAVPGEQPADATAPDEKPAIERMADIVIGLKAENESWQKKFDEAGEQANLVITKLRGELRTARDEIERLNARQREAEKLSPRVLGILQEHATKEV